jgi:hypothetical protein
VKSESCNGDLSMLPYEKLAEVFDRGLRDGVESLSADDRDLFLIQDFIIEFEMNSLGGYFYNRLPDHLKISSTIAAMQRFGLSTLALLLGKALILFQDYRDPGLPTTWSEILRSYDPQNQLEALEKSIHRLDDYGLADSKIE